MAKQKQINLKPLIFDWDTAPDETSGFTEVQFPDRPLYYLNFEKLTLEPKVVWWITVSSRNERDSDEVHTKVVMDFASDIETAKRAAEAAFIRLLKPAVFNVVA
ncbi:Hypothetical protein NGAL_HAMBI2610_48840 [Neorhizobium galegae bv. orientalis]|nr:Hypothetical protein NGAL_HAMBI2610_48840 [Neorhizobium galegae bv. orientalis]